MSNIKRIKKLSGLLESEDLESPEFSNEKSSIEFSSRYRKGLSDVIATINQKEKMAQRAGDIQRRKEKNRRAGIRRISFTKSKPLDPTSKDFYINPETNQPWHPSDDYGYDPMSGESYPIPKSQRPNY